jgi:D-galactonate transporter
VRLAALAVQRFAMLGCRDSVGHASDQNQNSTARRSPALSTATFSPDFEKATYKKVTWRLIPFLFLCYILAYLDRVNVGFAKLQMASDLHFSDTVYGIGAGMFFIGYFFFEVPSNVILQKVGAKVWIARIMIMWGIISAAFMYTGSIHWGAIAVAFGLTDAEFSFYFLRFLLGVAEAGFFPGIILYLTFWYTRTHRAKMVAAFMTAVALAGVFGGPISGWILHSMAGVHDMTGWQWLYLLEGLPSVIVGVLVLVCLDDGPLKAKWLTVPEKELLAKRLEEEELLKKNAGESCHSFGDAFRNAKVWWLSVVYFGIVMGTYGISFWLPQIIKETITKDPWEIGLISAIPWAAAAIAMVLNGNHSDATGERRWHVALACLVGSIAFAVSALPGVTGWGGIAALTVACAGVMSAVSCFWSLPTGILSGTAAAAGIALINSIGNLAGYVSPYVVGKIRDATHSMTLALSVLSVSVFIAGLVVIYVTGMKSRQVAVEAAAPSRA